MTNLKELIKTSNGAREEMFDDEANCAQTRWKNKKVEKEEVLIDFSNETISNVSSPSSGKMSLSQERTYLAKQSLLIEASTDVENKYPRPGCGIAINFKEKDITKYNRVALYVYCEASGYQNFYFHFWIGNENERQVHATSLEANKWNYVLFEINNVKRDKVSKMTITPFLMGCPPEATPTLKVYIDKIMLQNVDSEHELGWKIENRVAFCHEGYFQSSKKIAIVGNCENNKFQIVDKDSNIVFEKEVKKETTKIGQYYVLDFSEFSKKGEYSLVVNNKKEKSFIINNNPYEVSIWKSMNFLRLLRCGVDVVGVHSACHLNCRSVHPLTNATVPNFGGWHDAGDVSQFEICTAEMAHAILDLAQNMENKNPLLSKRLIEEAKVGIEWLLRTRFSDGYRALAVTYSIWRGNVLTSDNKSVETSKAENGPFENFLAAAAEAKAAVMFSGIDDIFAAWSKRAAIEDFDFAYEGYNAGIYTKRWGPTIVSQTLGHGAVAAAELYLLTKDEKYIELGSEFLKKVLKCQQSTYPNWERPIRGFFYEDEKHQKILSYEHRGHEQSPVQGLAKMYEVAPNHKDSKKWLKGMKLYKEFVLSTIDEAKPYNLLPAGIYDETKLNDVRFTIPQSYGTIEEGVENLKRQIREGSRLNENVYLRKFPIAVQRRGYHATLLSKVKGISAINKVLKSKELRQIVIDQLEWVFGKNPFASSTMYGEGYNYHPLYVAFSRQMVGSLPVGIETLGDKDEPYWPVANNAVYKEIWGHTTGKYLWVLADIL